MTTHFSKTRCLTLLACVATASLLAACGSPSNGYYDRNGNFIPTDTPYNISKNSHSPLPGGVYNPEGAYDETPYYTRRGYYDYNGYYLAKNSGLTVPTDMFPPRGMCRVWFTDRVASEQPPIESCSAIRSRVPAGAYVIYGG